MKTAAQIIKEFMEHKNGSLKDTLEAYELTDEDITVCLYDEEEQSLINISEDQTKEQPIQLWYSITNNKPYGVFTHLGHEKIENNMREERLKAIA